MALIKLLFNQRKWMVLASLSPLPVHPSSLLPVLAICRLGLDLVPLFFGLPTTSPTSCPPRGYGALSSLGSYMVRYSAAWGFHFDFRFGLGSRSLMPMQRNATRFTARNLSSCHLLRVSAQYLSLHSPRSPPYLPSSPLPLHLPHLRMAARAHHPNRTRSWAAHHLSPHPSLRRLHLVLRHPLL